MLAYAAEVADAISSAAPVVVATVSDPWNQLVSTVIAAVIPIIVAIGTYGVVLVRSWIKSKIDKIKNSELRAAADFAMQRLDFIVMNVVKEIQQAKPSSVVLTKEQKKQLQTVAFNRVKAQVTDDILEIVRTVVKDPDRYTITKIEAAVGETKLAKTTAECK